MKRFILISTIAVLFASCQQEQRYAVDFADRQVTLQLADISGLGTTWTEGDIVYFSDDVTTRPGYQYKASAGKISADGKTLNATYESAGRGAEVVYALRGKQGRIHLKTTEEITLSYDGTLGGSGIQAGTAPVGQTVLMNQILPLASFTYSLRGIASIRITADEKIFPEKVKYNFGGKGLTVVSAQKVVEVPAVASGTCYLSLIPVNTAAKLTFTFLSDGGFTLAESTWSGSLNAIPGKIFNLGAVDGNAENVVDPDAPELESAADAVKSMGVGLNNGGFEVLWKGSAAQADRNNPAFYERQNGSGLTTQTTMDAYAAAGFKCVRIPVTWWPHMDNVYDATIDKVWLDRIEEVVGYCQKAGLYCIINVHHDAHAHEDQGGQWIYADTESYENITKGFQNVWKQIALRFKNYDAKVLFEGYNEITDINGTWTFPKNAADIEAANKLNQDFVNVVRKTGGNNVTRNLVVSSYTCSVSDTPLKAFVMPADQRPGHLIWQVHSYAPGSFCSFNGSTSDVFGSDQDYADIKSALSTIKRLILDKGWPCIIGEYGSPAERQAQTQQPDGSWRVKKPEEERAKHAYYYTLEALKLGVVPIYWYNPMDGPGRTSGTWKYPILKDSIIKAWEDYNKL